MNRLTHSLVIALLSSVLLAGCATVGKDFATHNVEDIEIGETTRDDIQAMFGDPGAPALRMASAPGPMAKYRYSLFDDAETTDLVVRFNQDGTVSSYVYNTTE